MNTGQMSGAAVAGLLVAAAGPGPALLLCGIGMVSTVPLLLSIRAGRESLRTGGAEGAAGPAAPSMLTELREGWSEFRSHTWLWVIVRAVLRRDDGLVRGVLGPRPGGRRGTSRRSRRLGRDHGGRCVRPDRRAAWCRCGSLPAAMCSSCSPAARSPSPRSLAMVCRWPLFGRLVGLGVFVEMMMVQWTVTMAEISRRISCARLVVRRPRLGHGDAGRSADRRPARQRDRGLPRAVRGRRRLLSSHRRWLSSRATSAPSAAMIIRRRRWPRNRRLVSSLKAVHTASGSSPRVWK